MSKLRALLHGGGGAQIGEVTCGGSPQLSCKRDQIRMIDYMDRRVTPPKRTTSPTWGPPPPYKQALTYHNWSNRHPERLLDRGRGGGRLVERCKIKSIESFSLGEGVYSIICGTQRTLLAVNCRSLQLSNSEKYWCHKFCVTTRKANNWTQ